jgi:uncharacterized protein (TIGR01244 family)
MRSSSTRLPAALALALGLAAAVLNAQQVAKPSITGSTYVSQLETTIACAGATGPEAMPEIKKLGFVAVINLRQASENGANVPAGEAAAKAAGLRYVHIPFNAAAPDPAVADQFITAIKDPANQPAFVHCASANRAAAMWMIKRLVVDRWDVEKASTEAAALGLTSAPLKQFALDYAKSRS